MYKDCLLPVSALRKSVDLKNFDFKSTKDIASLTSVIGQVRAVSSINFALEIDDSGYNVFVTGSYGTGRTTIVTDLLNKAAKSRPTPSDWVFVYNFNNPDEPNALQLPSGQALKFKKRMNRLIFTLNLDLQKTFESKTYMDTKNEIVDQFQNAKQLIYSEVEKQAASLNIRIKNTNVGFATIPIIDGKAVSSKDFPELSPEQQQVINKNAGIVQKSLQQMIRKLNLIDREMDDKIDSLNEDTARFMVDNHFEDIIEAYDHCPDVIKYIKSAADDIVENVEEFTGGDEQTGNTESGDSTLPYGLNKYQINILIDNSRQKGDRKSVV